MIHKRLALVPISFISSILIVSVLLSDRHLSYANDGAAEITPHGLQFRQEKNIVIEKEELYLSHRRIEVSYVLRNTSAKDITTEIAFPIPEYTYVSERGLLPDFNDFAVEVNGKKISYRKELRAFVDGSEVTDVLKAKELSLRKYIKCRIDPVVVSSARSEGEDRDCFAALSEGDRKRLDRKSVV